MKKIVLFFVFLFSCGSEICDDYTSQGVCLVKNDYDVETEFVEQILDVTKNNIISWDYRYDKESTDTLFNYYNVRVQFVHQAFSSIKETFGKPVGGWCWRRKLEKQFVIEITMNKRKCYGKTFILIHEFIHMFMIAVENDSSHRGGWFWHSENSMESNRNSLQSVIFDEIKCDVCECR